MKPSTPKTASFASLSYVSQGRRVFEGKRASEWEKRARRALAAGATDLTVVFTTRRGQSKPHKVIL